MVTSHIACYEVHVLWCVEFLHVHLIFLSVSVVFDPQSVYSFGEFELACSDLPKPFHAGYHSLIPQLPGHEVRQKIALYFVNLLMYYTQGPGGEESYREQTLKSAEDLLKALQTMV